MLKDVARHHHNPNLQKTFSRSPSYKAVVLLSCNSSSCLFSTSPEDGTVFRPLNSILTYFNHYMIGLSWKLKSRRIMGAANSNTTLEDDTATYSNIPPTIGIDPTGGSRSISLYQWSSNDLAMIYQWSINDLSMIYQWSINAIWCYMMLYDAIWCYRVLYSHVQWSKVPCSLLPRDRLWRYPPRPSSVPVQFAVHHHLITLIWTWQTKAIESRNTQRLQKASNASTRRHHATP